MEEVQLFHINIWNFPFEQNNEPIDMDKLMHDSGGPVLGPTLAQIPVPILWHPHPRPRPLVKDPNPAATPAVISLHFKTHSTAVCPGTCSTSSTSEPVPESALGDGRVW